MKKISKFGLMLGVTLLTMNLYAGTAEFTLDVKKEQGKKMVTFALNKMSKVDLSIYDAEGKLINFEKVDSQKNINRTYDLRALPEGTYFLEAESDMKISRFEISVVGEVATLSANPISEIYKPTFVNKKGLIQLTFLNLDKSPVNIKVYDKANNEVYDSDVILDQDVKKVFDINKINDEEYTFVMTYKDRSYSKTFASN
jgi:hypothetical protein